MAKTANSIKMQTAKQIAGFIKQTALTAMISSHAALSGQAKQMADNVEAEAVQAVAGSVGNAIDQAISTFGEELSSANRNIDTASENIQPPENGDELETSQKDSSESDESPKQSEPETKEKPKGSAAFGGDDYWKQMADALEHEEKDKTPESESQEQKEDSDDTKTAENEEENEDDAEDSEPEEEKNTERPKGSASFGGDDYWGQMADAIAQEEADEQEKKDAETNEEAEDEEDAPSNDEDESEKSQDQNEAKLKAGEIQKAAAAKIAQKEQEKRAVLQEQNTLESKIDPTKRKIRWELTLIAARGFAVLIAMVGILVGVILLIFGIGFVIIGFCVEFIAKMFVSIGLSSEKIVEYKGEISEYEKEIEILNKRIKNIERMIQLIQKNASQGSKQIFQRYLLTQQKAYGRK